MYDFKQLMDFFIEFPQESKTSPKTESSEQIGLFAQNLINCD